MSYIELHARSAFSFLRGGSLPEDLVKRAKELGMPAIALCDRDGVYGAPRLFRTGKENEVRGLVGAEITMEDGSVIPLLVQTLPGYKNLSRMLTTAHLNGGKGNARITWEALNEYAGGLVALTGDEEGPVVRAWRNEGSDAAGEMVTRLSRVFEGRLYVELQRHLVRGEERRNNLLRDLAEAKGVPLVATNGVLHALPVERAIVDIFTCIRNHTHLDTAGLLLTHNGECCLKPTKVMERLFRDLPQAVSNTERIADGIDFTLENLGYQFPTYRVPPGETMDSYLAQRVWAGAAKRYGSLTIPDRKKIEEELNLIRKLGFSGYFLVVWEICEFCRRKGIFVQGRGSSANSIVCYTLEITNVDPIKYRLLFDRFLCDGRATWPDIDLDLPSGERRESVIQEVYRRYGERGAAMTANVISFRGKSAMRELAKALNLPLDVVDRFSSLYANGDFPHTMELEDQLNIAGLKSHPRLPALMSLHRQIQGLPRHLGQHSGGMIICEGQLDSIVPLERASMPGRVVVQWDKDDCEDLKIVKVDLLGLGMVAALQDSLEMCAARNRPVDLATIPKEDPATFDLMCKADTIGVFQIESRAQMATLPRLKPKEFYDVAVQVAIIRPGPIQGASVNPYLERRAGRQTVDYMGDERLKPILERTLGIVLFQEQILGIAIQLANYTGQEADKLRRAFGFKRSDSRIKQAQANLRVRLAENGAKPQTVDAVIQSLSSFALYGFPESHAISFAIIAYASAYLKVHRPAEFYAGLLNNQPMGFYAPSTLVQDGRRHGIHFKPVCVLDSSWGCTVESDDTVRLGFRQIKGIGETAVRGLLKARMERAFISLEDFLVRTHFSAAERRALAAIGALNGFSVHRREAIWQVEAAVAPNDLFSCVKEEADELSPLAMMSHLERLEVDYRTLSLTVGDHPLKHIRSSLVGVARASDLPQLKDGSLVTIAGSVICRQRPGTAKGFVFISLEDETGVANAVVRPDLFERRRLTITQEPALRIIGRLQIHQGVIHVKAETIIPLKREEIPSEASHDFR